MAKDKNKQELNVFTPVEQMIDGKSPAYYPNSISPFPPPEWETYGYDKVEEEDNKIHLRDIWRKIRKHKLLIFSIVTIITTVVAIQVFRTKPWYSSSAVIEVRKENSMVLKSGEVTLNDDADPYFLVNVNTKMLALNNRELFEEVVVDQKLDQNPEIVALIEKKSLFSFLESSKKESAAPTNVAKTSQQTDGTTRTLEETHRLQPYVDYLEKNLNFEQVKNTRAIKVTYTSEDPNLASAIPNSLAKIFRQHNFDDQTEKFTNSANWLETTTRELKAKVESAEESLARYTREHQIYARDTENAGSDRSSPTLTTSKLTQLHDQLIRAQTERMLKQSLYKQVQEGRIAELPESFSDPKIIEFQKRLAILKGQLAELSAKFGEENPRIVEVKNQIADTNSQIEKSRQVLEAKLKADYERTVQDEKSFQNALDVAKVDAINENQAAIKYNILKQDVETSRSLYTDFLQKTNQAKAQVAEQNNSIRILQNAQIPQTPVGPRRLLIILAGFLLSLSAGIGLAFFIEYLDNTIKTAEDLETYVKLPTLGLIPKNDLNLFKNNKSISLIENGSNELAEVKKNVNQLNLLENLNNNALVGESYRALRTSILLSSADNPPKTILVTSSTPSEGKTTTAINTAIAMSQLGGKVVIIDCDLRRPSVHKQLGISHVKGVTTFLSTKEDLASLIIESEISNLSVLPSGPIPPNPTELLSSKKMKELIFQLSESYDHVIVDSPPIASVTDPIILSTLVDGTILVVSSGRPTRELVQRSKQELLSVKSKIFGVVLNNVDLKKEGYAYNYYRYEYSNNAENSNNAN